MRSEASFSSLASRTRSTSGLSSGDGMDDFQSQASKIDKIFPLYDEMFKSGYVPSFLSQLLTIEIFIQFIGYSYWPAFYFTQLGNQWDDIFALWIYRVSFLSKVSHEVPDLTINLIVFSFLLFLIILSVGIELGIYLRTRRFNKISLSFARICIDIIPQLCVIPSSFFAGLCLRYSIRLKKPIIIVYCVIAFLYLFAFLTFHFIQAYFSASLPYIGESNLFCWSGSFLFQFLAIPSFFIVLSFLTDFFPTYFKVLTVILKILMNVYFYFMCFFFPFAHTKMNYLFNSLFLAITVDDILVLLDCLGVFTRFYVAIAVTFGCFLVSCFYCKWIFSIRSRKVCYRLSYDALETIDDSLPNVEYQTTENAALLCQDERTRKLFYKIGLHKSESKCELYFRVGLADRSQLFLNWSLLKFASEFHRTAHMATIITQFMSFFPCETRLLSSFQKQACQHRLNFSQRFLIFQIDSIKRLRQSSASREISEKLLHLKNASNTLIDDVRKFWINCQDDLSVFYDIRMKTKNLSELYQEAMEHWPNNMRLCEGYSHMLIEGAMDYKKGVLMKYRADSIEQGKNFATDLSFRSLVRTYPEYLKKGIMDLQGNFRNHSNENGENQSTSGSNSSKRSSVSSGTIDGILDPEIEESISKQCFTYHRLRLEFQTALENRKIKYMKHLNASILWSLFLVATIAISYYCYFQDHYSDRTHSLERQIDFNYVQFNFDLAFTTSTFLIMNSVGIIPPPFFKQIMDIEGNPYEINIKNGKSEVGRHSDGSSRNLTTYMQDIMESAIRGDNVESLFVEMISRVVPVYLCNGPVIMNGTINESLKELFIRLTINLRYLATMSGSSLLFDPKTCELLINTKSLDKYFLTMMDRLLNLLETKEHHELKVNKILIFSLPAVYAILSITPLIICIHLCIKELKSLGKLLSTLPQNTKENTSKSLSKSEDEENSVKDTMKTHQINVNCLYLAAFLPLFNVAIFIGIPLIAITMNRDMNELNYWTHYSTQRAHHAMMALSYTALGVISNHPLLTVLRSKADQFILVGKYHLNQLSDMNNNLLRGTVNISPVVGYSTIIDENNIKEQCIDDKYESVDHNDFKCSSLDNSILRLYSYLNLIQQDPRSADFGPQSEMANAFHLANTHINKRVWQTSLELQKLGDLRVHEFRVNMTILCWISFGLTILITILSYILFGKLTSLFQGELQMMRRIPPLSLTSSQNLMNYITHKRNIKKSETLTGIKSAVVISRDSVIFVNKSLNIDWINNSTTKLFGYTPDQLLGQPVQTLLPEVRNEEFFKEIEMMKNGQCALTYEASSTAISDDEQIIPVHVTLVGIPENGSNIPKGFAVIIRDETILSQQRKIAENAKSQSEKLLYQILPRDIVIRINRGESDINFSVPSATIVFIDIVKFSNYAATLNPSEIMEHLSIIFAKFDMILAKYNLLTKIKLIGDVYMAAAGLFNPDENPANHAAQVINFSLEALTALEEANNQFNSSLQVRIGVNTGGPLIAGVLGTDKPVFDIIGDPINVAARLQSTAIPGTVQISEDVFNLISSMNYNIEKRGEIELKGKGKRMAYAVRPLAMSSFFNIQNDSDEVK